MEEALKDLSVTLGLGFVVLSVMLYRIGSQIKKLRTGDFDPYLDSVRLAKKESDE